MPTYILIQMNAKKRMADNLHPCKKRMVIFRQKCIYAPCLKGNKIFKWLEQDPELIKSGLCSYI